jgi:hemerythrin-like domain-containing protein
VKRSDALAPLSRDHQHGLHVALLLKRATAETAASARDAFLQFWSSEGHAHFRAEEDLLLPVWARYGAPDHEAVLKVLVDHVELRRMAADLDAEPPESLDELHALGVRLNDHIRFEERVFFPLVEETLPDDALDGLLAAFEQFHHG